MKKYLFIISAVLMAAMFTGCSKEDEGGQTGKTDKIFSVQVPDYINRTREIPVCLSVKCDTKPIVTFSTEGDAMGVVSLVEKPEFDTEYIYADELIDVQFDNGTATAAFWYFPLSSGSHGVSFTISYTQDGVPKTETSDHILAVSDAFIGGFEPEVVCVYPDHYDYCFRNSPESNKSITGCDFRIALLSFNDKTNPAPYELSIGTGENRAILETNVFHSIKPQYWTDQDWKNRDVLYVWNPGNGGDKATAPINFKLICRDNYNRCRDIVIKTDVQGNVVSSEISDYYLWDNRK